MEILIAVYLSIVGKLSILIPKQSISSGKAYSVSKNETFSCQG